MAAAVDYDESIAHLVAAEEDLKSQSTSGDLLPVFVMPEAKRNAKKVKVIIKLQAVRGKLGEFWAHIACFWLA